MFSSQNQNIQSSLSEIGHFHEVFHCVQKKKNKFCSIMNPLSIFYLIFIRQCCLYSVRPIWNIFSKSIIDIEGILMMYLRTINIQPTRTKERTKINRYIYLLCVMDLLVLGFYFCFLFLNISLSYTSRIQIQELRIKCSLILE